MGSGYSRDYYAFSYLDADSEIEWVYKRPGDMYPQTRESFIETIKTIEKKFLFKI